MATEKPCLFLGDNKMNKEKLLLTAIAVASIGFGSMAAQASGSDKVSPTANGIEMPAGYKDWRVLGVSQRTDNNTLRVILGNDAAIAAARSNRTNPWPDGAVIGKVVWKNTANALWEKATAPGELVHAEFMIKDRVKYAATGGWGYARWKGMEQKPHGVDAAGAAQECVACHAAAKSQDFVFTRPAALP